MIETVLASNNKKKIEELRALIKPLTDVKVLSLADIDFRDEIVEDGASFEENSLIKANTPARLGYIGIADDSGLAVDCLGGAPGIFSARYSGEGATDESNRRKVFADMDGVPEEDRTARFVCTMSIVLPEGCGYTIPKEWQISAELSEKSGIPQERAMVVRGECHGYILTQERGEGGFGYDCMFWYPDYACTFAEVPAEKKALVSHRGIAMREFTARLAKIFGNNNQNIKENKTMLNSKQRATLRGEASKIEAIFQVGKGGVGNTMASSISDALDARELVKLTVLENSEGEIENIAAQVAEKTGSEVVACIGRKIILYRESSKEEKKNYSKLI